MFRKAMMASAVAAAVGVPMAVWNSDSLTEYGAHWTGAADEKPAADPLHGGAAQPSVYAAAYDPTQPLSAPSGEPPLPLARENPLAPLAGPAVDDLGEVLRLDVSREWVLGRWGRVTTAVADLNYDGLRVPLVSGPSPSDLAGSLTYYFDRRGQVQRIAFHGTVGDPQRLAQTLTAGLEFRRQPSLGGHLYTRSYLGSPMGVCRLRPAAVIDAGSPLAQYEVILEINRPGFGAKLSEAAQGVLDHDRQAKLW